MSRSEYDYLNAAGDYVFTVVVERGAAGVKKAWQGIRNGDGSIAPGLNGLPEPPLYRLPELTEHLDAGRREPIYVVEGEKDVEALRELGCTATTNPMGAGKWRPWHTDVLIGARRVVVVADADDPGRAHARVVHRELRRVAGDVELLTTPATWASTPTSATCSRPAETSTTSLSSSPRPSPSRRRHPDPSPGHPSR